MTTTGPLKPPTASRTNNGEPDPGARASRHTQLRQNRGSASLIIIGMISHCGYNNRTSAA